MTHGYHGRFLRFDLSKGQPEILPLREDEARAYLGGAGLAASWLYRHAPANVDPLGPDNPLILASCPLVDTGVTTTAKAAFAARSPQTGFLGESLISSRFAISFKRAGWDGLVVTGSCRELSVLVLNEEGATLLPLPELAGTSASEAETTIRRHLGLEFQVAAIGPAGEQRVRYATISHDGRHAGRTGLGAVMGAKNLKAIAVRGRRRVSVAAPDALKHAADRLRQRSLGPDTAKYRLLGTSANLLTFDRLGVLPARNFRESRFEAADRLTGEQLAVEHRRERSGCAQCAVGCEHRFAPVSASSGQGAVRAEYESLFALGPLLGLGDPDAVLLAVQRCDEFGMDTLSFGGTVAWAMEAAERGVLSDADLATPLRFGNGEAVLLLAEQVARRNTDLGNLLAEGSRLAALRVGQGSEAWAMHVKGLELPGYEPRALKTLALGLAVGARGACHNRSSAYDRDLAAGKERLHPDAGRAADAVSSEDQAAVLDALVVCKFLRKTFTDFYAETAELLRCVTGWAWSPEELRQVGARIVTLKRLYNQREGATRADDTLPPRLLREAVAAGASAGAVLTGAELDAMLDGYYACRGWNPDGTVPPALANATLLIE